MRRPKRLAPILFLLIAAAGPNASAQPGSAWHGVIDANVPFDFHADRFDGERITGTLYFWSARFDRDGADRLCDSARIEAVAAGGRYRYTISGGCRGRGELWFTAADGNRMDGRGTIHDAASASGYKRRHFFMKRR